MKNTRENQLKKAIFLTEDEFLEIFIDYDYLISFGLDAGTVDIVDKEGLLVPYYPILAEYFDVAEVTSVHTDNCGIRGIWIVYKEKNKVDYKIVRLDIVDNQPEIESERILETFYLVNPDEDKITLLQKKMKSRFDENDKFYDEEFNDNFSAIYTFIEENFSSIGIDSMEVEW